ncbi:hypothetical protein [Corynebacterium halotolerans]|uniref:Uncharacterized protein n=1 Tax=Corynebacterium halotolerans YIM 70093 = DSM 44683 TaxID=1121362 RepID=M1NQ71_9CORY|nr:hypothetical protein [Corynebacterium halotolerans]AGF73513.1 hypothetical protein A605_12585 [Corynebacterium halotolerans YIM 70093 = DSM 44683]
MATLAFVLAALAVLAAALLWYFDARQRSRRAQPTQNKRSDQSTAAAPQPQSAGQESDSGPEPEPEEVAPSDNDEPLDVEVEETAEENPKTAVSQEFEPGPEPPEPGPETKSVPRPEPDPGPEPAPEPESVPEPKLAPAPAPDPEPEPEPTSESAPGPDDEPDEEEESQRPARSAKSHRASGLLPGSLRRERRAWATEKGFDFLRSDEYLNDEWARGAAASGAAARDIVRGEAFGHEMVLMDLGGVNVMAVRRGGASGVVVDFRRESFEDHQPSDDLIVVRTIGDFHIFATESGPAERLIDKRVTTALSALPEVVTAVWMESDWVLAQTDKGSHSGDWEAMLAPLALLADAARVLPPRPSAAQILHVEDLDPTRRMAPPGEPVPVDREHPEEVEPLARPLVVRPEEPLEMPTRVRAETRGVVEPRAIGADEVEAIADGAETDPFGQFRGTRMPRDLSRGPSIFDDDGDR